MKHLKDWKVFENINITQSEVEEIIGILKSKCLELNDREFITDIEPGIKYGHLYVSAINKTINQSNDFIIGLNKLNPYDGSLKITITSKNSFYFNEISGDVLDIIDFMGNEDWKLHSILISRDSYSPEEPKLFGDKLYGFYSGKEIDYAADKLILTFKSIR
jgi:hypothetical protein